LLASAIGKMDGLKGYAGWRWIFILEGVLTCVVSLFFFFFISAFPEDAKWLREDEREYLKLRLYVEQGPSAVQRNITLKDVLNVFKDFKIFIAGFMYFGMIVSAYGYAFFSPTILATYGYSPIESQLHSVPPWACAFVFAMLIAFLSDYFKHRFLFAMLPICVLLAAFGILLNVHDNRHVEYGALFLVAMGAYTAMPVIVCWFNMNLGGHHRRAVGSAWQVGFGNIAGIIATYAFISTDAPYYHNGYAICVSFACLSAASCCAYALALTWQNRARDRAPKQNLSEDEKAELGDTSPDYRYFL